MAEKALQADLSWTATHYERAVVLYGKIIATHDSGSIYSRIAQQGSDDWPEGSDVRKVAKKL